MQPPSKYKFEYQTNYTPEYTHMKIIYASSEAKALTKFRSYCKEYGITITELEIIK